VRLLVTGGAGFIGSNFVSRTVSNFLDNGVTVVDSLTYAGSLNNLEECMPHINFVEGDIRDGGLIDRLVSQADAVVHFAAESHNDNSLLGPELFFDTNVMGTLNIAQACVKHNVRLHHISTDEVFGDLPLDSDGSFTRETPYHPSSPYSASKAASDHLVRAWVRSFGLQATISNCSNNYGPNQHWEKLIPATIKSILEGRKPIVYGNGLNVRDWIHVDDHTDGIWAVLNRGEIGETYLLGAKNQVSNIELVSAILGACDRPTSGYELVADRPGHDLRYAIDPTDSEIELGWVPEHKNILDEIPALVSHFKAKFEAID
jgi:dTDP-glucose 4,6-dehydratase